VNGRTRFRIEVPAGLAATEVEAVVRADPQYADWTAAGSVERMIVVPDRIVNVILR
jgi:leucyl-tRNA synthetase